MLRSLNDMENFSIRATDGDIGQVKDFYFDDKSWVVRYLIVEAGSWLNSKKVLISPISIQKPNWADKVLPVMMTKAKVKQSPDIDTDKPVSRQHEMQYHDYYGYPYYWGGNGMWGGGLYPYAMMPGYVDTGEDRVARAAAEAAYARVEQARHRNDDAHLRSCKVLSGYHIHAKDGEIGHVESFLLDQDTWAIRYMVVNTSNWWVGHKVLVAPEWITGVQWESKTVSVAMTREAVKTAPAFVSTEKLNRGQEASLYAHYGRPGYWPEGRAPVSGDRRDPKAAQASE